MKKRRLVLSVFAVLVFLGIIAMHFFLDTAASSIASKPYLTDYPSTISSINPDSAHSGDMIWINGQFDDDGSSSVWIEDSNGIKTELFNERSSFPSDSNQIFFKLGSNGCAILDSDNDQSCTHPISSLKPGPYVIYYEAGSVISNTVPFIITPTSTPTAPFLDEIVPWVTKYIGEGIHVGSAVYVEGSDFDPISGYAGIGWLTHSHAFVMIKNTQGQAGILWEGDSQGGATSTSDLIATTVPSSICMVSEVAAGECPPDKNMPVSPGEYSAYIVVDGRGTSNAIPLVITNFIKN